MPLCWATGRRGYYFLSGDGVTDMQFNPQIETLAMDAGIVFDGAVDFLPRAGKAGSFGAIDGDKLTLAMDAVYNQPGLVTTANSGILSTLTTMIDPKLVEVLLAPLKSEDIYGVTKKGDWLQSTAAFGMIEMTGSVASYGDFNEAGRSDANAQWPMRQNYIFQTFTEWGDRELELMGLAKIDWASRKRISSANSLNRFMNQMNFYGVAGLQNYGGLNDPSLSAALTPGTKALGGTSWSNASPNEILVDVQSLFSKLQTQCGGNLDLEETMTLAISPTSDIYLANTNSFGLTAAEMIRKAFPNLTVKTAPQYLSGTTYSCQLIVDSIEGQRTAECAFSEKMRGHRMVQNVSSTKQKSSAGGWGTIIYRPIGIASMAGI